MLALVPSHASQLLLVSEKSERTECRFNHVLPKDPDRPELFKIDAFLLTQVTFDHIDIGGARFESHLMLIIMKYGSDRSASMKRKQTL